MYRIDCPGGILLCPATQSRPTRTRGGGFGFREREEGALGLSDADVQGRVRCELETVLILDGGIETAAGPAIRIIDYGVQY